MINEKVLSRKNKKGVSVKRRRNVRKVCVTLLLCVFFVALAVGLWMLFKPLEIREVAVVSGGEAFESAATEYLRDYVGKDAAKLLVSGNSIGNILKGRLASLENEMKSGLPLYKNVTAKVKFGGKLEVSGEPREAFLPVDNGDNIIITDRDGYVVAICEREGFYDEFREITGDEDAASAVVSGIKPTLCLAGEKMTYEGSVAWKTVVVMYLTVCANASLAERAEKLIFAADGFYIYCKNGVRANFGASKDEELFDKLGRLSLILGSAELNFENGTIYLSDGGPDTFRPDKARSDEPDVKIEIDH